MYCIVHKLGEPSPNGSYFFHQQSSSVHLQGSPWGIGSQRDVLRGATTAGVLEDRRAASWQQVADLVTISILVVNGGHPARDVGFLTNKIALEEAPNADLGLIYDRQSGFSSNKKGSKLLKVVVSCCKLL